MGRERALILGGGGPVGIAWEAGVLTALADAGLDVGVADSIVGTSAGSVVGALLALGRTPAEIAADWGVPGPPVRRERERPAGGAAGSGLGLLFETMREAMRGARPGAELAARLGAAALAAPTPDEARFLREFASVAEAAAGAPWPAHYACTALDARDGSFVVWDAQAGVDLVRAVASSCAVPCVFPPISLHGSRFMDGGVLSPTNAHLAEGHERVLVISVTEAFLSKLGRALGCTTVLEREVDALRAGGARVEVIQMDLGAARTLGAQLMNPEYQARGLEEGVRQGRSEAERILELWSAP